MAKALSVKRARQLERGAAASDEAVREAVFRRIDGAGDAWVGKWNVGEDFDGVGSVGGVRLGEALLSLVAAGRLEVREERPLRGRATTAYRSVAAAGREAWFRAEVKRRGLDRPRSVPVLGAVR